MKTKDLLYTTKTTIDANKSALIAAITSDVIQNIYLFESIPDLYTYYLDDNTKYPDSISVISIIITDTNECALFAINERTLESVTIPLTDLPIDSIIDVATYIVEQITIEEELSFTKIG